MAEPYVLGISASHNGAACLMHGGRVLVAVQEERLSRRKRARLYAGRHSQSVRYCLDAARIRADQLDMVVVSVQGYSRDPAEDVWLNPDLRLGQHDVMMQSVPHHYAHALSVVCTAPCDESSVLVVDGGGSLVMDLASPERDLAGARDPRQCEIISMYHASESSLVPLEKHFTLGDDVYVETGDGMPRFGSLGTMFQAVSKQIFGDSMQAGKVMGLAPYGQPRFAVSEFLDDHVDGMRFSDALPKRFRSAQRWPDRAEEYKDLARSVQNALEHAMLRLVDRLYSYGPRLWLCISGGVALNGIVNELLLSRGPFKNIYVYPASEDSGVAVGAAAFGTWKLTGKMHRRPSRVDQCGRTYGRNVIDAAIDDCVGVERRTDVAPVETVVEYLNTGKVVGLFQGGSELGPRALGSRSLLFDARRPDGQDYLNRHVKGREAFRPFAPACLEERAAEWFMTDGTDITSPFMLRVVRVRPEKQQLVPAITHVDGTARLQTVTAENGRLYEILCQFYDATGVPMLLNTSFNVAEEPLVETPDDALLCMLCTSIDACLLDDVLVTKAAGFQSLLDARPEYVGGEIVFAFDSPAAVAAGHGSGVTVTTNGIWGAKEVHLSTGQLKTLRRIDGVRNGRSIVAALQESDPSVTAIAVSKDLAGLARLAVIRLRHATVPRVQGPAVHIGAHAR